ncbi:MAG: polysaccharide biosynthesis/export family protein, partial [Pyrinomonadaceae bacterium]
AQSSRYRVNKTPSNTDDRYRVGAGDVLEVRVFDHPELSRETVRVDQSGFIRVPLVEGDLQAACLTESEIADTITGHLAKYIREPHVDVFVHEFQSRPVAVIGSVNSPGRFVLQRRVRLLELLTFAGGTKQEAGQTLMIVRSERTVACEAPDDTSVTPDADGIISFKLSDVLAASREANPYISPGDTINIPKAAEAYVVGNVYRPMPIPLTEQISVSRAVAMAGGPQRLSKTDKVRIIRQDPEGKTRKEIIVNLKKIDRRQAEDIQLQANDIIDIPSSKSGRILDGLSQGLLSSIAPVAATASVRVVP